MRSSSSAEVCTTRTSQTALRTTPAGTEPSSCPSPAPSPRLPTTMRFAGSAPTVSSKAGKGRPAKVLIDESAAADLLLVGQRGHGGFAGLVLGSVSRHVAAYAKCAVTVVR